MLTCSKCGSVNNPDSKFCFSCGNPMTANQTTPPAQPATPNQPYQPMQAQVPNQPYQPAQPVTPNQPYQPAQPATPNQPYSPMQAQVPNQPYSPNPSMPPNPYPSYVTPPKKNKNLWAIIGSGIIGLAAIVYLIINLTSLGSTVMGFFGLGKSNQFLDYYNEISMPIYNNEFAIIDDLNKTLLQNNSPDFNVVYQKAPTWKASFEEVNKSYNNAKTANDVIKEVNNMSIQRSTIMIDAMDLLIQAIEQNDENVYKNQFIGKINEYNDAYNQWDARVKELMDKYNLKLE